MRKAALIIVPLAGAAAIGVIAARKAGGCNCPPGRCVCQKHQGRQRRGDRPDIWARMEQKMAEMPETFPPRVMFDNVAVIRKQTTRILELLEEETGRPAAGSEPTQEAGG